LSVATAALVISAGIATAQTTSSQTTTTTTTPGMPLIVAPPTGTLSTERTQKTTSPDGTQTDTKSSTYRNTNGVANDSETTTTRQPPATTYESTTKKSTTTVPN